MTHINRSCGLIGAALMLLFAYPVSAQESRLSLNGSFREAFSAGPVTGTRSARTVDTLVGVRIGSPDAPFDATNLRVVFGATEARGPLCLRLMAKDGRYSASASYQTASARGTPAIDAPTRYADELKAYRATDIAVAAFVGAGCDMSKASELFVAVHGSAVRDNFLMVQVNSSASRVRAQLSPAGQPPGALVSCPPLEGGPRVGFTAECRIAIDDVVPGSHVLTLLETTSSGASQSRTYPIRIIKVGP